MKTAPICLIVSPAVSGGAHRQQRGGGRAIGIVLGILVLAAVGAGAWWFFLRPGAPIALGGHPVADFSFDLSRVNGTAPGGELSSENVEDAAEGIRETLDAMYVAGFIDPGKWDGGTYPEVLGQFTESAVERASADLAYLTLGGGSDRIAYVDPALGTLKVRVLLAEGGEPAGAVATTRFVGDGAFDDGGPMFVIHDGTYFLQPDEGEWLISGYDVHGVVQPGRRPTGQGATGPTEPTP